MELQRGAIIQDLQFIHPGTEGVNTFAAEVQLKMHLLFLHSMLGLLTYILKCTSLFSR